MNSGAPPFGTSYQSTVSVDWFATVTVRKGIASPRHISGLLGFWGADGTVVQEQTGGVTVMLWEHPFAEAVMVMLDVIGMPVKVYVPFPLLLGTILGVDVKEALLLATVT